MCKQRVAASFLMCTNVFDKYFQNAVNSCINQTVKNIEIVIVVNGVDDSNEENIKNFCKDDRIALIFSKAKYLTYNLNLGLQYCNSNYVARMDADDISHPNRIERQLDFMSKNNVAVCGSSYRLIDKDNVIIGSIKKPESNKEIRKELYFSNPIAHPSVMFKKDSILSVGGYMGGEYAQDYDLWLRLVHTTNLKFYNLDDCLLDYRVFGSGARSSKQAYSNVSSIQWRYFVLTYNPIWLLSSLMSFIKRIFYSKR